MNESLEGIIIVTKDILAAGVSVNELRMNLIKYNCLPHGDIDHILSSAQETIRSQGTHTREEDSESGEIIYSPHNGFKSKLDPATISEILNHAMGAYRTEDTDEVFKARDICDDGNPFSVAKKYLEKGLIPDLSPEVVELGDAGDHEAPLLSIRGDPMDKSPGKGNQSIYILGVNSPDREITKMAKNSLSLAEEAEVLLRSGMNASDVKNLLRSKTNQPLKLINSAIVQARGKIRENPILGIDPVDPAGFPPIMPVDRTRRVVDPTIENAHTDEPDSPNFISTPELPTAVFIENIEDGEASSNLEYAPSLQREKSSFLPKLGIAAIATIGALTIGNALWPYVQDLYTSFRREPVIVQEVVPERIPLEIPEALPKEETLEERVVAPVQAAPALVSTEDKIFSYDGNTVTINPLPGYGLATYAAMFTEKNPAALALLSYEEQKRLLKEQRTSLASASKTELGEILAITTSIAQANADDVYKESLTLEGIKDPKNNVIYAGVALTFPLEQAAVVSAPEESRALTKAPGEEKVIAGRNLEIALPKRKEDEESEPIFTYLVRDPNDPLDDTIQMNFSIPGVGISQYTTVLVEEGWNRENLYALAQWMPSEQATRVREASPSHIRSLDTDAFAPILDITRGIIQSSLNSADVHNKDLTQPGIKDGKRNIVYLNNFLLVSPPGEHAKPFIPEETQISLDVLVTNNDTNKNLPKLNLLIREYFELRQIVRDVPFLADEPLMTELVGNIAQQYNAYPQVNISIDPLITREERVLLAQDLYQRTAESRDKTFFMSEREILDLVNEGLTRVITSDDLQTEVILEEVPIHNYPLPERKTVAVHRERRTPERVTSPEIIPVIQRTLTDPLPDDPFDVSREAPVLAQRIIVIENPRIAKKTLIPRQVQAYMNVWEMLLDNPGTKVDEAKAVLEPLAYKISEDYGDGNIEQLNLSPLPKAIRLVLARDLQNLGDTTYVPEQRIFDIVNAGFAPSQAGYIHAHELQTAMMDPSPYTLDSQLPDLEKILRQTDQSYERIQEPERLRETYFTARHLEDTNVLSAHEASEKLLTQLVVRYKEGKDIAVEKLDTEQRRAIAAQLYSSPDFADKRYASYMATKDMEAMLNPEGLEAISRRDMREAGKESFGRTRRDAEIVARDLRREEVYSLYLVKKQENPELTPYQFSRMQNIQEDLHMKPATIKRDVDWNISLSGE